MMIDRLEPRLQFASISGTIYTDADHSETHDANEAGIRGTTVFIDANQNGTFDSGETSTTTDKKGRYTFSGLAAGDYTVGTTTDNTQFNSTNVGKNGTKQGRFNIDIVGLETATPGVKAAFVQAEEHWESIITGDVPDQKLINGTAVDDLRIKASIVPIDGGGSASTGIDILGQSEPTAIRAGNNIPYLGEMQFDSFDLAELQANGQLNDVILHEMGHVLGFGSTWKADALVVGSASRGPRYIGENAIREYNSIFHANNLSIPVENTGGSGSRGSHWKESLLHEELMTPEEDAAPQAIPLSRVTVGQFQDEGYQVNYNAADVWNPVTHVVTKTVPTDFGAVAFERTLTVAATDATANIDFGYQKITAPVIRSFSITPAPVAQGQNITLKAAAISDADGDALAGVSFWRESNGIEGLQKGSDTPIGVRTYAKAHAFSIQTSTTGLLGDTQYYAVATDSNGLSGRRTGVVNVQSTTIPVSIPTQLAVRQRSSTAIRFAFVDNDVDVTGYRIQVSTRSEFGAASLVYSFNISSDTTAANIGDLRPGLQYYVRVRAFNLAGATIYSQAVAFETI